MANRQRTIDEVLLKKYSAAGDIVKNILSTLTVSVFCLIILLFPSPVSAALIFSDTFQGGYNTSWYVPIGSATPVPSPFGISGENSNNWSVINYPIVNNGNYLIQFDIKINQENTTHAWGIGLSNNSGSWKFTGNWGQELQIHDSSGSDKIVPWNHTVGIHHFDIIVSTYSDTPFIVSQNGNQLYSLNSIANFDIKSIVVSLQGNGDYELANFTLSTYEEPTPTPTPEPTLTATPSPTPTPTVTPTPTPKPNQPKKVIFLHGMGGSWNADALLNCKTSGYSGSWSPWTINNFDIYSSLIHEIQSNGYTIFPYYYDWRKTTNDTAQSLKQYTQQNIVSDEAFYLVGHSFGGLVGRAYINDLKENSHIDKFLTIGTPHKGSVFAYPAWSGGELWLDSVEMRLGFTILKIGCSLKHGLTSSRSVVQTTFPAIENILPLFDYLKDTTGQIKSVTAMTAKNSWLPDTFTPPYYGITIGTITGTGYSTLKTITTKQPSRADIRAGDWKDGKPTSHKEYADGDGTVLSYSSQLPDTPNIILQLDHSSLVTNPLGINAILDFLNGEQIVQPLKSIEPPSTPIRLSKNTSALFVAAEGARFTLTDKNGKQIQDSEGQITILDPDDAIYILKVTPAKKWWWHKTRVIVVQLFEDGTSAWKQYIHPGGARRLWKLRFDRKHRSEDILKDK